MIVQQVLRSFADLTPGEAAEPSTGVNADEFFWQGVTDSVLLSTHSGLQTVVNATRAGRVPPMPVSARRSAALERFASLAGMHPTERLVWEGWCFLVGNVEVDGVRHSYFHPLISIPLRIQPVLTAIHLWGAGDIEVTRLINDRATADRLEATAKFGDGTFATTRPSDADRLVARMPRLQAWIHEVVAALGLKIDKIVGPSESPFPYVEHDGLVVVVGAGIYLSRTIATYDLPSSLLAWARNHEASSLEASALGAVYSTVDPVPPADEEVISALPLTAEQRRIVVRSRHERLTVVSGMPGNGKSHTVAAIAFDAVGAGQSVLVATQSHHAAEVLAGILSRQPGPQPVMFGSSVKREELLDELEQRMAEPAAASVKAARRAFEAADANARWLRTEVVRLLEREADAADAERIAAQTTRCLALAPGVFEADADHAQLEALLARATATPSGWLSRRRARRALTRLRRLCHAGEAVCLYEIGEALRTAEARRAAAELAISGGTVIGQAWDELAAAEEARRRKLGDALSLASIELATGSGGGRRAVGALMTALRSGRGTRRQQLYDLDGEKLTGALPIWVGTLDDIEDLLPARPGVFDLVILDEASQVDQMHAAPALLRAKRAVVVGDSRQLRHIPFAREELVAESLARHGLSQVADRLDVRRCSIYDAAAMAAPVTWLTEHHRSLPHLIEFSAQRFYRSRVGVMTRHPASESADLIEVVRLSPDGDPTLQLELELQHAVKLARAMIGEGATRIGVVTPFESNARELENRLQGALSAEEIIAAELQVGSVHSFQGSERDVIIAVLGLNDRSPLQQARVVEDPHLFNVMITRARRRMTVITSLSGFPEGLVGDYLRYGEAGLPPTPGAALEPGTWTAALAEGLRLAGVVVRSRYPVGHHEIDLCLGEGRRATAAICAVHPHGPEAHVERHLALRSVGWRIVEAFPSVWDGDAARAAVELAAQVR